MTVPHWQGAVLLLAGTALIAGCTPGAGTVTDRPDVTSTSAPAEAPTTAAPTSPPLSAGVARGHLIVVQRAEDAALVSGAEPVRLTLVRTRNEADWITAPPQRRSGMMSTEQAMLTLGWRPSADGTTSAMPRVRPNGLLAHAGGTLAFTLQRANVRPDGTLVLDIRPMGPTPDTVESYGPVTLTLDGAPGVLDISTALADLTMRVIVTGSRNDQAVVQVSDSTGRILESAFLSAEEPSVDTWLDVTAGDTTWSDPVVTMTPPTRGKPGTVRVTGTLTVDGASAPLDRVIARWSIPLG